MEKESIRPIFPKEHGLWFWIFLPVIVGGLCAGGGRGALYLLIWTIFFGFLALTPARIFYKNAKRNLNTPKNIKFWCAAYLILASAFGLVLCLMTPRFVWVLPFMAAGFLAGVRAFHGGYHQDARFEYGGVALFSLGSLIGAFAVAGGLVLQNYGIWLLTLLFVLDRTTESRRVVRLGEFRLALAGQQPEIAERLRPVFLKNIFGSFMTLLFALAIEEKFRLKYSLFWPFFPGFVATILFYLRPPQTLRALGYSELALAILFGASFVLIFHFY